MMTILIEKMQKWSFIFNTALTMLPILIWGSGRKSRLYKAAYKAICVMPPNLYSKAAEVSLELSRIISEPAISGLFHILNIRLTLDSGHKIGDWSALTSQALSISDSVIFAEVNAELKAEIISEALTIMFHPKVHQGTQMSPIASDPLFAAKFNSHETIKVLVNDAAQNRRAKFASNQNEVSSPRKLLVLTDTDFDFMGDLLDEWSKNDDVILKARNLRVEAVDTSWWNRKNTIIDRLLKESPEPPSFLKHDLDWADVIFVEWGQSFAARLSGAELSAKLVVRLHRYEAFIQTPILTNWSRVDSLITITPYISSFLERSVPGIERRTNLVMIPNINKWDGFYVKKSETASKTLGMIQFSPELKDPNWALDVLEKLLIIDSSWKLKFVGGTYDGFGDSRELSGYYRMFEDRINKFGNSVEFVGFSHNLPETLKDIGVILSTSQLEGSPVSLLQGVASGAFPVVRNWPLVKSLDAAHSIYPAEWIVETPDEAAKRIIGWTNSSSEHEKILNQNLSWLHSHFNYKKNLNLINNEVLQG